MFFQIAKDWPALHVGKDGKCNKCTLSMEWEKEGNHQGHPHRRGSMCTCSHHHFTKSLNMFSQFVV